MRTPTIDRLADSGVLFANHWANAAPCGPSRACLYTGTYLHHNRSLHNGTPLDARFTNVALLAREAGYDPVLFGYTDTSVDPRTVAPGDPRLSSYEGVLPGFRPELVDRWEEGSPEWGRWLAAQGVDVPANPHDLYRPVPGYPGAEEHGSTWAPARFAPEQSQSVFVVGRVLEWLERHGDRPFFVHASFIRPHPPRRNPPGYHDCYSAEEVGPFVGAPTREAEAALHPFNRLVSGIRGIGAPDDERERRQLRATYYGAQREVDDTLGTLVEYLDRAGLLETTLVVLTSDHGEMGCDHWLLEKLGYWDESYHVPLVIRDPGARPTRGAGGWSVRSPSRWTCCPPCATGSGSTSPCRRTAGRSPRSCGASPAPGHWRDEAHFEWHFSNPETRLAEQVLGLPMSHCSLAVARGARTKYVQFAADPSVLPPLLFDLDEDPAQLRDRLGGPGGHEPGFEAAQRLVRWRMRNEERTLSGRLLTASGPVEARDAWR